MGFNAGDGDRAYEESDHSGNHANLKQLPVSTNSDERGMFIYHISRANIRDPKCESGKIITFNFILIQDKLFAIELMCAQGKVNLWFLKTFNFFNQMLPYFGDGLAFESQCFMSG